MELLEAELPELALQRVHLRVQPEQMVLPQMEQETAPTVHLVDRQLELPLETMARARPQVQ